jgi:hypothetical protein
MQIAQQRLGAWRAKSVKIRKIVDNYLVAFAGFAGYDEAGALVATDGSTNSQDRESI